MVNSLLLSNGFILMLLSVWVKMEKYYQKKLLVLRAQDMMDRLPYLVTTTKKSWSN